MKKVYGSSIQLVVSIICISISIFVWVHHKPQDKPEYYFLVPLACLLYLSWAVKSVTIPEWAYGEKGIETYNFRGKLLKTYAWTDVTETKLIVSPKGGFAFLNLILKDKAKIAIGRSSTGHLTKVLADVVRHMEVENPGVEIDPSVSDVLKNAL